MPQKKDPRSRFTILDFVQFLGGVLALCCILSYVFTGTSTWGYTGKYLNSQYYKFVVQHQLISHESILFTTDELALYNGTDTNLPIYVSVNGTVFDVSYGRDIYGPDHGRYHLFAGHDYSRVFVNGCFHRKDQWTFDLRGLDEKEAEIKLQSWIKYYRKHPQYWEVGQLQLPNLNNQPIPEECRDGLKLPSF
ncbi:hypothetical protein FOA43_000198 [Brettanomyces nanus]|uniref:Cytochrome b5 heme-binding domain-containing protein n=1 Tax=Eeniella nana TaxID=13502 RepID=A0A875RXY6_EENNA|nr:uncharacterized protein FOA43_000198 [Brettanomyces nanus]QPG72895.1 hypothetical protein FOA43_000198 [Brettanomyces nanus]